MLNVCQVLQLFKSHGYTWGLPKIRGTVLGIPLIRTIVYCDLYWGPSTFGKLPHVSLSGMLPQGHEYSID